MDKKIDGRALEGLKRKRTIGQIKQLVHDKVGDEYSIVSSTYVSPRSPLIFFHRKCGTSTLISAQFFLLCGVRCRCEGITPVDVTLTKVRKLLPKHIYAEILPNQEFVRADKRKFNLYCEKCYTETKGVTYRSISERVPYWDCSCGSSKYTNPNSYRKYVVENSYGDIGVLTDYAGKHTPVLYYHAGCNDTFWGVPPSKTHIPLCPYCNTSSKGERTILNTLRSCNILFEQEKTFPALRSVKNSNYLLRYDFYLPEHNVLIEFHGRQHYDSHSIFHSSYQDFIEYQQRDKIKEKFAEENGITLKVFTTVKSATAYIKSLS